MSFGSIFRRAFGFTPRAGKEHDVAGGAPAKESHEGNERGLDASTLPLHYEIGDVFLALTLPREDLNLVYGPEMLRIIRCAAEALLEVAVAAEGRGPRHSSRFPSLVAARAAVWRQAYRDAVNALLLESAGKERAVRALAWALDARKPWYLRVRVVSVSMRGEIDPTAAFAASFGRDESSWVWWLPETAVPRSLVDQAREDRFKVLADARSVRLNPENSAVVLDANPAIVSRPNGLGASSHIELTGSAAMVQALLGGPSPGCWRHISPPRNFFRLLADPSVSEAVQRASAGEAVLVTSTRGSRDLLLFEDAIPKSGPSVRYEAHGTKTVGPVHWEEEMTRLIPTVVYPESEAGADPLPHGQLVIVAPFMVPEGDRSKDELAKELKEESEVSGIQDICRRFGVRMEADVRDPDGQLIHLSIPVKDEDSFTPEGMTQDPSILKWYVGARTYEDIQGYMTGQGIHEINEEQAAGLERLAGYIAEAEKAVKEVEKGHDH